MKKILQLAIMIAYVNSFGQSTPKKLPFYEGFNYGTDGGKLCTITSSIAPYTGTGLNGWAFNGVSNAAHDDIVFRPVSAKTGILGMPTYSATPTPSWFTGLPNANGNPYAIYFTSSGIDPYLTFTNEAYDPISKVTTGKIYASFIMNVQENEKTSVGGFTSINSLFSFESNNLKSDGTGYDQKAGTCLMITAVQDHDPIDPLKTPPVTVDQEGIYKLGIAKEFVRNTAIFNDITTTWAGNEFFINEDVTVVMCYDFDTKTAKLWINPQIGDDFDEPETPDAVSTSSVSPLVDLNTNLNCIRLTQTNTDTTPEIIMDEIRVARSWFEVTTTTDTGVLGLSSFKTSQLKVYPNPVIDGKLNISSASTSEKKVAIYSILGQKVMETKTTSEPINVAKLAKGSYVLKITEDGRSETKKLLIQ